MRQYCPNVTTSAPSAASGGSCANPLRSKSLFHRLRMMVIGLALLQATLGGFGQPVSYDIVYVRQPRLGDNTNTIWPEVFHPARLDPGADLMLLHPDGTEEVLVAGGPGSVTDPFISFDGRWCIYSYFPD